MKTREVYIMKSIMKRIMTMLLAFAMLFVSLPVAALAEGIEQVGEDAKVFNNAQSNSNIDPLGYVEIDDGYLNVRVSKKNGGFSAATAEGNALSKRDNNADLTYPDDAFDTSFTSFRVTRGNTVRDYIFGRDYSNTGVACSEVVVYKSADNAITAEWSVDGLYFKQTIALMGADTYQHGMAYISYSVTNTGSEAVDDIEARVMMDTALGTVDYGYYMLAHNDGSYTAIETERTVNGADYSNYFFAYDDKVSPRVTSYTLNASVGGVSIVPTRVTFAHWANLASTVFDYTPDADEPLNFTDTYASADYLTADSAVALYYDMNGVSAASEGKTIGLYYGVYSNYNAGDADVSLNFISSGTMFFDESEESYKDINGTLPGNFSTTLKIQNITESEIGKLAVAVYPEEAILPHNGNGFVTDISPISPYYKEISGLKSGEERDVRFDFMVDPTYATGYRRIKIVVYNITVDSKLSDANTVLEDELFILCPGAAGSEVGFTGITPEQVFVKGKRFAYITGTNFGLIRDKTQYRIVLRPNNGGDDVVLDQDKVVVNTELNTVTLVLDMELDSTTYKIIFDWNDTTVEDMENEALRLVVTDVPSKGDPGYVSSGVYGIVTVERNGMHYDIVNYPTEEDYKNTKTSQSDIMLVLRGDFNVLSTDEKGNYTAEAITLMDGDVININDTLDVKNGRVTITKNFDDNGNQTEITVDIDGKVYTTKENTKVWDGVLAITSFTEGKLFTLPIYSETGVLSYAKGEEDGERITLLWPGAAGGVQTLVGLLLNFRYGEFALMKQGDSYARVVAFGASLDPSILVPNGKVGTTAHYSKLETAQREMGVSNYTAAQLRATDLQFRKDQMAWRDKQAGTLNLYMDDILFGAGGFIGFNTQISVGIPAYADGLPYIEGTLSLKIINDYWEFGVEGSADMLVFEMEASLKLKSYNGIPVPDEIYFFIGGTNPGIPVDPFGVFWVRGAGAGISNMYETFFGRQTLPPITLMLSGEFAIFAVLSARADISLSPQGIAAQLQNVGIAGITLIDRIGGSVYWYPSFSLSFGIRVDILDAIIGEGSVVVKETADGIYFCGYASVTIKIPDSIWIIGGLKVGSAAVGIDTDKVWGSAEIIGIGFGIKYYWGGKVSVSVGDSYDVPKPRMFSLRAIPVYTDASSGKTLYMDVTNAVSLDDTEIFSETDGRSHRFTLDSASGEDGLLVISYSAENILMAQDYKNNIKVNIAGNNYKLEWYDPAYDADHVANIGTNAIFHYNAETMMATVSISFTDVKCFDNEITVSTPTYSEPSLMGIARTTRFDSVALNPEMTEVTVNGEGLALLSELSIYAQDKDGALYLLASVASDAITEDSCTVAIEIPKNLPTGSYTLKAIGTVRNSEGEEIASPAVEASFDFVNENQPKAPISATLALAGNYTVSLNVTAASGIDGYLTTIYEVTEHGYVATVFKDIETAIADGQIVENGMSILLGGRFSNTDEHDITTYYGLEAGKLYAVSVQGYKITENGARLFSEPLVSNDVMMVMPTVTTPVFRIENAKSVEVGDSGIYVDAVSAGTLTVEIDGVGDITSGYYTLGNGEKIEWNGGNISFETLEDGMYTLAVEGVNETMDSFTGMYQFSVDTTAPGLLLSSPQGGGFFSGTSVTVSGITEAYAKLVISVTDGATTEIFADEKGNFIGEVELDDTLAYQELRIHAVDGAGNESMPFGCTLTNEILGDPDLVPVILYGGREISALVCGSDPKQLTMAFKSGNRYVTMNEGSSSAARIVWNTDVVARNASISNNGVLTGDSGAMGIVTASLDNMTAYVSLISVDLTTADITLEVPEGGFVYDGTEKKPAVTVNANAELIEGVDYTVSYLGNTDAGTASVVIVALEDGKCVGTSIQSFTILPRSLSDVTLKVNEGKDENPAVTLMFGNVALVEGRDYTVSYTIHENGKRGIVTVEGIGNYKGFLSEIYEIYDLDHLIWIIPTATVVLIGATALAFFFIKKRKLHINKGKSDGEEAPLDDPKA